MTSTTSHRGPLQGIRVIDFSTVYAGPITAMLLGDYGADVLKVELPAGDPARTHGWSVKGPDGIQHGLWWKVIARNKEAMTLDVRTPEGREIMLKLVADADVMTENFRPGVLEGWGLGPDALHAVNPRLVLLRTTGFGQDGPYAARAGYDFMIQGMGGIMDLTGAPEGEPQKIGVAYVDIFTGVYSVVGILAALFRRDRTGQGAHVDMALLDVQTSVLANQAMNYLASGQAPRRMGNAHPNIVPYQVFPVADGHVIVAVGNDGQFARFVTVLGRPELAQDERFRTNAGRVRHRLALVPVLTELTLKVPRDGLLAALEAQGVPAGPINTVADVFADPQVIARGMRIDLPAPAAKGGAIPSVRSPIVLDGEPMAARRPSPRLGEHTQEVLSDPSWIA
jgi:crotonobetainyl-CoA:carnitine CoA-transferase CaiB-like acyl-CoA transferase